MRHRALRTAIGVCVVPAALAAVLGWALLDPDDALFLQRRLIGRRAWEHRRINREIREEIAQEIAELEWAVEEGDDRPETLVALAEAYDHGGRDRDALLTVRRALAKDPGNQAGRELQIRLLYDLGRHDEMERMIDDYTAMFPDSSAIWFDVYLLYSEEGSEAHYRLAKEYFKSIGSGERLPKWSEYCAEHGYPLWPEGEQEPHENDN